VLKTALHKKKRVSFSLTKLKKPKHMETNQTELIHVSELSRLCALTERRLRQLSKAGTIPAIVDGNIPRDDALRALFAHFREGGAEYAQQRLLLLSAKREQAELKVQEIKKVQAKRWIEAAEAYDFFKEIATGVEQLPGKWKSQFGLNDVQTAGIARELDEWRINNVKRL
jgi:hypothetical protein